MSDKLKPCPFCGNEDIRMAESDSINNDNTYAKLFRRQCSICYVTTGWYKSREEADRMWSTRTPASLLKRMAEALEHAKDILSDNCPERDYDPYALSRHIDDLLKELKERG